jgi:hypothetical protein
VLQRVSGAGSEVSVADGISTVEVRFYRVVVE